MTKYKSREKQKTIIYAELQKILYSILYATASSLNDINRFFIDKLANRKRLEINYKSYVFAKNMK